jgi:hypothetical protein
LEYAAQQRPHRAQAPGGRTAKPVPRHAPRTSGPFVGISTDGMGSAIIVSMRWRPAVEAERFPHLSTRRSSP